jgi:hypothetical protein
MAETKRHPRESISTRIDADAHAVIERIAELRRTTAAQVARILLEDGAKELGRHDARWLKQPPGNGPTPETIQIDRTRSP